VQLDEPILVVDDDEAYRILLRHHLEAQGYKVIEAEDGIKAYSVVRESPIGLMILDLVMPNEEGLETIFGLRREGFCTKILAVSGASQARIYLKVATRLGADAGIEKIRPISELLGKVHSLLKPPASSVHTALKPAGGNEI
jgi:DNA-binding response OmpR family regulator